MGREVIEQRAGDGRLADAALVRTDYDHCWLSHRRSLIGCYAIGHVLSGSANLTDTEKTAAKSERVASLHRKFRFYTPRRGLEASLTRRRADERALTAISSLLWLIVIAHWASCRYEDPRVPSARNLIRIRPGRRLRPRAGDVRIVGRRGWRQLWHGCAVASFPGAGWRRFVGGIRPSRRRLAAAGRSGPGSWPPANLTSAATRLSTRRMGVEQFAEALARIVDAHFHHRGGRARQFAAALDLAQRRDHGVGIFGELDRAGVGEKFARARQRQPDDERQHIGDDQKPDRDQDRDARAAAAALVAEREPRKPKPL